MTDTVYVYGKSADRSNLAGRLAARTDASGTVNYMYGKLGEITQETRKISSHIDGIKKERTATMEYRSDYLGRMQEMTYPDGERVEYAYDYGGNVCGISGKTNYRKEFCYVKDIGYDEYGQRNFIEYGNGVKTEYEYNPERRWLSSIRTENENNIQYQNIEYKFDTLGNILSYTNDCLNDGAYKTSQSYTYDALGQLTSVSGSTEYTPYRTTQPVHVSEYSQKFVFDEVGLGRMMNKTSSETTLTGSRNGDDLNYAIDYVYAKGFAHRLERAGNRFYKYDANGNVTQEEYDGLSESDSREVTVTDYGNDVYGVDRAWGYFETDGSASSVKQERHYRRTYVWDVRNRLTESHDSTNDVYYIYGEDGIRTNKYTREAETIYFNNFWTWHKDGSSELDGGKNSKHIFLGTERLVTKVNSANRPTDSEEMNSQYFYHSDHLGSAQLVTNQDGEVYQRIEYTPYGETWIDMRTNITALYDVPYRFTAKELDKETGLYYYGARYLDPKYSRWISTDPALGEYISPDKTKEYGIFNFTSMNLYHYGNNNPVNYVDPDGRRDMTAFEKKFATEILGCHAPLDTKVYSNFTDSGSFSSPTGFILISKDLYSDSFSNSESINHMMHELFHQVQYKKNTLSVDFSIGFEISAGLTFSSKQLNFYASLKAYAELNVDLGAFPTLVGEFFVDEYMRRSETGSVYDYPDLTKVHYKTLSDFPYLESQAEMIGDFSKLYYDARYGKGIKESDIGLFKRMAEIIKNSGYNSEAVKWVSENY